MFDWEEEELTNMIWGDEGEKDDRIVPFKARSEQLNRKERSEEYKTSKPDEKNITETKTDLHDDKLGSSSGHNVDEGLPQPYLCMSTWSESSLSNARKIVPESSASELSKCLAEPVRYDSTREKTSELGKGPDIFHSTDESIEQGDFDEYGWANIGSFDDLDRMFSNDVPIFGDGSLSGADELWPSSKDVSSPKSLSSFLDSQHLGLDIGTECEQQENQQFPLTGKVSGSSSQSVPNVLAILKAGQYREHKGQPSVEDQPYQLHKMMKFSNMSGSSEAGAFQDMNGQKTPSRDSLGKFMNQLAPPHSSLKAVTLQSESQGSGTSHYSHMPNQYMATSAFGNLTNPYSSVPVLSAVQHPDIKNKLLHASYNPATATSVNMATDASARPSIMTPQEKLEKLRRRQQMQAMLAIQRQQQQFSHHLPVADQSITQNCCNDIPLQLIDTSNLQGLTAMPSFDPNSSLEQDNSGNFVAAVNNSAKFSVLYRLQDLVGKLDMQTRTCIRDSLFRLAGSAAQRHSTNDTDHSNKTNQDDQEVILKEESRNRYAGMPDTEAVTNPSDRTVAHLLFHRPFDMSPLKHMEGPKSPASSKVGTEEKRNSPKFSIRESQLNKQKGQDDGPADSLALGNTPNSGSSSNVGERTGTLPRKQKKVVKYRKGLAAVLEKSIGNSD